MFLGATNDFNSPLQFVIRGFRSLPNSNGAMSFTPHMNHRFTADNYAARVRWFEAHLKNSFTFPETAAAQLHLKSNDGIPRFTVRPDPSRPHELKTVTVFYGYDRDPRAILAISRSDPGWEHVCRGLSGDGPGRTTVRFRQCHLQHEHATHDAPRLRRHFTADSDQSVSAGIPASTRSGGRQVARRSEEVDRRLQSGLAGLVACRCRTHRSLELRNPQGERSGFRRSPRGIAGTRSRDNCSEQHSGCRHGCRSVARIHRSKARRFTAMVELPDAGPHSVKLPVERFITAE